MSSRAVPNAAGRLMPSTASRYRWTVMGRPESSGVSGRLIAWPIV